MKAKFLINVFLGLVLSGCSSMQVVNNFDPDYDFTKLKSYNWSTESDISEQSTELEQYFKNAMQQQLASKGFSYDENNAEFVIEYHFSVQPRMVSGVLNQRSPGWGNQGEIFHYDEGTMVVDFLDTASNQLIYRSSLQAEVNRIKDMDKRKKRIDEAVEKILEKFPPGK